MEERLECKHLDFPVAADICKIVNKQLKLIELTFILHISTYVRTYYAELGPIWLSSIHFRTASLLKKGHSAGHLLLLLLCLFFTAKQ